MIISASRRTDIPAFYSTWLMNRVRAGYCAVPNPFHPQQVAKVSLKPEDVDVIVFWTRNPAPLLPHLPELDQKGYRYYFQFTLLDYPRPIEAKSPRTTSAIHTFQELCRHAGTERVIWRYDPILISNRTDIQYHLDKFRWIAESLNGYTKRVVISLVDSYRFADKRLKKLQDQGITIFPTPPQDSPQVLELVHGLVTIASSNDLEITSCAETYNLQAYGVKPGKCVDDVYIERVFGISTNHRKDPSQRLPCNCVLSKDIGMYDSCLFGCSYCYATIDFDHARKHHAQHNPDTESML